MKTIIHVNQHVIKSNRKNGVTEPVLTVKTYKSNIYSPDKPLSCGAHVWIETEAQVEIKDVSHNN
jgi:hypothetical protein